ncbi:hypothetical protein C8R46DRAFT_1269375 [Mycena filopes]|nr:hypothetical protein C8R46DRAFT_1269375 [Mycena filopes]
MPQPDWTNGLPPEICVEIFLLARDFGPVLESQNPFLLGQICSRWRSIALDAPSLWTSIMLASPKPLLRVALMPISSMLSVASTFIERSRQLPLELTIDARWSRSSECPVLDLLLSQSHRWELVQIYYLNSKRQYLLTALRTGNFPRLKSLRFTDSGWPPDSRWRGNSKSVLIPSLSSLKLAPGSTDILTHLTTPHLKHLSVEHSFSIFDAVHVTSFLQRSASALTRLSLHNAPLNAVGFFDILQLLHGLEQLEIHNVEISDTLLAALYSSETETVSSLFPRLQQTSLGQISESSKELLLDVSNLGGTTTDAIIYAPSNYGVPIRTLLWSLPLKRSRDSLRCVMVE